MPKDWLAALLSFPAVLLDETVEFIKRIFKDEEEIAKGSEHDPETDEDINGGSH